MQFKVVTIATDGCRHHLIVHAATGEIAVRASEWLLIHSANRAPNTVRNRALDLCVLLEWEHINKVNLCDLLLSGQLLSVAQITELEAFLRKNFRPAPVRSVKPVVARRRQRTVLAYINWVIDAAALRLSTSDDRFDRLTEKRRIFEQQLTLLSPASESTRVRPKAIDAETASILIQAIQPGQLSNPFPTHLQARNFLLLAFPILLGLRVGELLGMKLEDIAFGPVTTIRIIQRRDDPDDHRALQAASKSGERLLPLCPGLFADILAHYLDFERPRLVGTADTPYLIVSSNGGPLTHRAVQRLFEKMRGKLPAILPGNFTPHTGRHTFSSMLEDLLVAAGIGEDDRRRILATARGDRSLASQDVYLQQTIQRRADRAILEYQSDLWKGSDDEDVPF